MADMDLRSPRPVRWTRSDYERMAQAGLFDHRRVERIQGEIIEMTPQNSLHAETVTMVDDALRRVFTAGFRVRVQLPLALGTDSDPEPDVAVVAGCPGQFRDAHPTTAVMVVEVADTSLSYDRARKCRLYAAAAIQEYWIVNLLERQVEVHRKPVQREEQPGGSTFEEIQILYPGDTIHVGPSQATIAVADLLP